VVFHALNGRILPSLDTLSLEHLRESTLSFFGDQSIFCNKKSMINNSSNIEKGYGRVHIGYFEE